MREESSTNNRAVGSEYESKAADYLRENGYEILEMNFSCRIGEIDIVARDGSYLCFVEVKYRSHTGSGRPDEAVNFRKQRNICRVADFYRVRHGIPDSCDVRFDVVSIYQDEITLYQNAFFYEA